MQTYYLTYNEFNKGVYKSQVIDTLIHYQSLGYNIKLICLLPLKQYLSQKEWIKKNYSNSIVLPAIPTLTLKLLNSLYLLPLSSKSNILCRGSLATSIALNLKFKFKKIILDARAAIAEEHYEYGNGLKYNRLLNIEKKAVNNSDFQISISNALISYWKNKFNYKNHKNVVIPCCTPTVSNVDIKTIPSKKNDQFFKKVVIVFSGSTHPWQSFSLNCHFLEKILNTNKDINVLFLAQQNTEINNLILNFGSSRVQQKWVDPDEVKFYLSKCDYGLLLRDNNITNNVSSPVKFSEYLDCGLNIIISSSIKDHASFVEKYKCGFIWNVGDKLPILLKNNTENKLKNKLLTSNYFKRNSINLEKSIHKILSLL